VNRFNSLTGRAQGAANPAGGGPRPVAHIAREASGTSARGISESEQHSSFCCLGRGGGAPSFRGSSFHVVMNSRSSQGVIFNPATS
jgi:hypothetical protein